MASDLALRIYTQTQKLREPMPRFSDDEVLDFMVREAVMMRGLNHEQKMAKERERAEWKKRPVGSGTPGTSM